jgi:hypothetical protein
MAAINEFRSTRPPKLRSAAILAAVGLVLAVLSAGACSAAPPRLFSTSLRLVYKPGTDGSPRESLSFFALASDDDGTVDLEELYLISDKAQLYWRLTAEDWIKVDQGSQVWIGSHAVAMPTGEILPRGTYRAVLIDKGGDRAERSLALTAPEQAERGFPSFSVNSGRYVVASAYPKNSLVVYDAAGNQIRNQPLAALSGDLAALNLGAAAKSAALWAEDPAQAVAAFTDPVPLR